MGLQTWPKDDIRQQDATVAKNYPTQVEIKELNRLTTILLDIFDDQLEIGKLTLMAEASALLDRNLKNLNRPILNHGGNVRRADAETKAKDEYKKFDAQRREERRIETERQLTELKQKEKSLPKSKGRQK
jgi:hypothetical protein